MFTERTPDQLIAERKQHLKFEDELIQRQHEELLGRWRDSMEQDKIKPTRRRRGPATTVQNP